MYIKFYLENMKVRYIMGDLVVDGRKINKRVTLLTEFIWLMIWIILKLFLITVMIFAKLINQLSSLQFVKKDPTPCSQLLLTS
jgi:hypothetical protein